MGAENNPAPANYKGVMVSSTFKDLTQHRAELIKSIDGQDLKSLAMEHDAAKPDVDVVDSSLEMVRNASAYIGIISHKYGQIPECPDRNPDGLSLTELEFDKARQLERPILLFIMGDDHSVKPGDVETDPEKIKKLEAFRENAKRMREGSSVHRVYAVFNSLVEFTTMAIESIAELRHYLDEQDPPPVPKPPKAQPHNADIIPKPPAFYAEPRYIGSHQFVGRRAQLESLDDWAAPANRHPILLFEAIGGSGKSMLTWEWVNARATGVRKDWAGRFWYSFYERGAIMADFCGRALAYITGQPLNDFGKKKTLELSDLLLRHLNEKPWLIVLDGLERVLVAYHRIDAAQLTDEAANKPTDEIAQRDPCSAIRPGDDELIRALAAAAPSKLLLTSRLVPRVLLNSSSQPIPGVLRERLPGLRPPDAEALLRACGVTGDSEVMQHYVQTHCDCHPLVTGVLAGLINDYLPERGNFDAWAADPNGGGRLNLADLDLIQNRNNILEDALAALDDEGRQVLSTLALLSEAVDYSALSALNPHLPPKPDEVTKPYDPEVATKWGRMTADERRQARTEYSAELQRFEEYEQALKDYSESPAVLAARQKLQETVRDLEARGLLQYDRQSKRYDLHPVVRGIAPGGLQPWQKERYGQRVVDYFSRKVHSPYENAESLEDIRDTLHVIRALIQMGRCTQAWSTARYAQLGPTLVFNLEAYAESLALIRPFFDDDWSPVQELQGAERSFVASWAAEALLRGGESGQALVAGGVALRTNLGLRAWANLRDDLSVISYALRNLNRVAAQARCVLAALNLANAVGGENLVFLGHPVNGEVGTWLAPSGSQICSPFACPYSRLQ